jgi:PAS domain S-box-containing protein
MHDKNAKILIVEDDEDVRRAVALWLSASGYTPLDAADGKEGLARIQADRPDAVLLDLRLPVLDGFEVLAAMTLAGGKQPPVIVISGQDEIEGVIRAFRMGAAEYLQKPIISFDLLGHALETILEREHLSAAVRLAETRYFNLVQNLPLLVFVLDVNMDLAFINKFCRTMLGFPRAEALAAPGWFLSRVHPEDRERIERCLTSDFAPREHARNEECRFVHQNGATVHALLRAMPATRSRQTDGPALVEGIVVDITDRVELERFVVQEEKLKTLGAISAEVAHEIRNPLFSIAGFAHRLQTRMPDTPEAAIILTEARRLEDILDKISNYLHPVDLRPRICALNAIATAALEFLAPEFSALGIAVEARLAPGMPELELDPDLLTQVVTSLVRFAAKRLAKGDAVRLTSSRHARFAHLDVAFTPETPLADPELLFLPFEVGDERMGLPLSYRIVKNMGGSLTFAQKGDEAAFTLQLAPKGAQDQPPAADAIDPEDSDDSEDDDDGTTLKEKA